MSRDSRWLRKVRRTALDAGWTIVEKKKGLMFLAPDGEGRVLMHGTQSDHRARKNAVAQFRRCGLEVDVN